MSHSIGILFIVATPIGNRTDISARALDTLRTVSLVAAEDTRNSGALLRHYGIETPLTALHDHNERSAAPALIQKLQSGLSVALVSDAGTPGISDPGALLVDAALNAGITVTPIPGPSAVTTLMSACGFLQNSFLFVGFLPAKASARAHELLSLKTQTATLVFYEAPHRIVECLSAFGEAFGLERRLVIGRELTKVFETVHRCTLGEALLWIEEDPNHQRGEFVLAIEGAPPQEAPDVSTHDVLLQDLLEKLSVSDAVRLAVKITGENRSKLYARALELTPNKNDN